MRIGYSRGDSDIIAKMKGTFQERPKRAPGESKKKSKKVKATAANQLGGATAGAGGGIFFVFLHL